MNWTLLKGLQPLFLFKYKLRYKSLIDSKISENIWRIGIEKKNNFET